jgi:hypothetical protein
MEYTADMVYMKRLHGYIALHTEIPHFWYRCGCEANIHWHTYTYRFMCSKITNMLLLTSLL